MNQATYRAYIRKATYDLSVAALMNRDDYAQFDWVAIKFNSEGRAILRVRQTQRTIADSMHSVYGRRVVW